MRNYTKIELEAMEAAVLSELYAQQLDYINAELLKGTDWSDLAEARHSLTAIGVALDVKLLTQTDSLRKNYAAKKKS